MRYENKKQNELTAISKMKITHRGMIDMFLMRRNLYRLSIQMNYVKQIK